MQKRLLAVAVAGVFAMPAAALAEVTITGGVGVSVDNLKFSDTTRATDNEQRVNDESSSIIFGVREDLGGGLAAIVRLDFKPNIDTSAAAMSGESYIGLSSANAGTFTIGRHNFHFFKSPWDGYGLSAPLKVHPTSLVDFAGGGTVAIANATRTNNSMKWGHKWGGFGLDVGYSTNPTSSGAEADMTTGNTLRKGQGVWLHPTFTAGNFMLGLSNWNAEYDAGTAADQNSTSLYGYYTLGALKIGALYNQTELETPGTGAKVSDRTAFSIPVRYTVGSFNFMAHYTVADDDDSTAAADGAKMWAVTLAYSLSKRTNVSVSLANITNDAGAAYSFFTSGGGLGSVNGAAAAGEDGRLLSLGMRHTF